MSVNIMMCVMETGLCTYRSSTYHKYIHILYRQIWGRHLP